MRILVFGDSITWGAHDNEGGGWVTRLRNKFAPQDVSFYNCGISGDTTDSLLARFKTEAQARKSEKGTAIIFTIGINDSRYMDSRENPLVPLGRFASNLETLADEAKKIADPVFFVGLNRAEESKVTPVPWDDSGASYSNANIDLYDSMIKKVAAERDIPFLDISALLSPDDLADGLHPNSTGHQKLAEAVEKFLRTNMTRSFTKAV